MNFGIFDELYFFSKTREIYGVKREMPFSILITEKTQVFQCARTRICTDIRKYVTGRHNVPPLGQIGLRNDPRNQFKEASK